MPIWLLAGVVSIGAAGCGDVARLTEYPEGQVLKTFNSCQPAKFEAVDSSVLGTAFLQDGPLKARWMNLWSPDSEFWIQIGFRVPRPEGGKATCRIGSTCSLVAWVGSPVGSGLDQAQAGSITVTSTAGDTLTLSADVALGTYGIDAAGSGLSRLIISDLQLAESSETMEILRRNVDLVPALPAIGLVPDGN